MKVIDTGMASLALVQRSHPFYSYKMLRLLSRRMGVGRILPGIHTFISPWLQGLCGPGLCHSRSVLQTPLKFGEAEVFLCLLSLGCSLVPIEMPIYPKYCFSQPSEHHMTSRFFFSCSQLAMQPIHSHTVCPTSSNEPPTPWAEAKQERENDDCVCLLSSSLPLTNFHYLWR